MAKAKNPQDATLRNVKASAARDKKITTQIAAAVKRLDALEQRVRALEVRLAYR